MIFNARVEGHEWLTLVVRASTRASAQRLAETTAHVYTGDDAIVSLEHIDPDGPDGVIIEDPS